MFQEDTSWVNAKMLLMLLASISALVAQFYPLAFPLNRLLLAVCTAVYFALSGVLQAMVTFFDRDVAYRSAPRGGRDGPRAVLRTALPRASPRFSVTVEFPAGTVVARHEASVGAYFCASGVLADARLRKDVAALVRRAAHSWGGAGARKADKAQ